MEDKHKSRSIIGAVWRKTSKAGNQYMSATIDLPNDKKLDVVIFPNKFKDGDNQPDFIIYPSEPRQ